MLINNFYTKSKILEKLINNLRLNYLLLEFSLMSKKGNELVVKPKGIAAAEEYFKNVHMTQEQHKIFLNFINLFLQNILHHNLILSSS
jgi:hypothetical protein